jgi:hypothetical protein
VDRVRTAVLRSVPGRRVDAPGWRKNRRAIKAVRRR